MGEDTFSDVFLPLAPGEGFSFNYQPSRIDRNALFALNTAFDREKVAQVRTKYHRAKLTLEDLRSDLFEYKSSKVSRNVDSSYWTILESVDQSVFGDIAKVVPLTHGAVAKHEDLPRGKSPGLPLKLQGYKTKGEAVDDPAVVNQIRKTWYAIERKEDVTLPDVACFARAQICSREKNKVRATWGYPLSVYLTEGQYFYPLLEGLKRHPHPMIAYGVEIGNGGMQYINSMAKSIPNANYLVGDYSKFDKTIPAWLIRDAFKLLERHIDFSQVRDVEGKLWPVREHMSKRRWNKLIKYFIDTPIQLSTGERFLKHGGVPSGSCFTNIIDSIVNAIVMRYLIFHQTGELPHADIYLGDDSLCVTRETLDLELLSSQAMEKFSMVLNADKSYQTSEVRNIHFLGYYNVHGVPYKPIDTIVASSIYPERPVRTKFETVTRLVGQAYSCFEPEQAKRFFIAADVIRTELDGLTNQFIEDYVKEHPWEFKYLSTLGIDVRTGVKFPSVSMLDHVWLTLDRSPRRTWKHIHQDLEALAALAVSNWSG